MEQGKAMLIMSVERSSGYMQALYESPLYRKENAVHKDA
jgi:hypothetical protein